VSYSILPLFGEYVQKGYNNASVTTANKDSATKYNVTKNLSGINLTLCLWTELYRYCIAS